MKTVSEALVEMRKSVENFDAKKTERINAPSLGDVVRQGDIYLACVSNINGGTETDNRQLAPGNTQGSRHVINGKAKIYTGISFMNINSALIGPAFKCETDVTVEHPEHGHKILPEGTMWQVVYQRAMADEIRRVQDQSSID